MKLYVVDSTGAKRHLDIKASSRKELANILGGEYFEIEESVFHVSQVLAEKTGDSTPISTVIGGALGLVGGMPGVLIGGALGALFGNESDKQQRTAIEAFNRS
ncbi:hypothetical protein ACK3YJ_19150 [Aeromonas caviae]|uniref:hypothetical protein n=1 Tax=Aeromonas caviae TaxID=648 RepID=UPI001CC6E026|nr:hypothetical protein [Aeromonas caviae]MDX7837360.1 hypothetical protein [Aeromonas caviae]MDY7786051.1 hypothetical protein [Aeromonas caviae]MEE1914116.1 hypothetical protein [Aeromonas caviae]GJA16679.1 hypothetical protein KAM335_38750 [Aeromonas caviae]GJA25455.1 hypothetical protein KAM337_39830 [Aeromonas caviae]